MIWVQPEHSTLQCNCVVLTQVLLALDLCLSQFMKHVITLCAQNKPCWLMADETGQMYSILDLQPFYTACTAARSRA